VEQYPSSAHALGHLAHVTRLTGDFERAEGILHAALGFEPGNDHLMRELAYLENRREQICAA